MIAFRAREVLGTNLLSMHAVRLRGRSAFPFHRHDFPELFWISRGKGTHLLEQQQRALEPGTLVFIRPSDAHGFASDDEGFVIQNLVFSPAWFEGFRKRHFAGEKEFWSGKGEFPEHLRLSAAQLSRLSDEFSELGRSARGPRDAERFLLNVLHVCSAGTDTRAELGDETPSWLEPALRAWADPREWAGGTRALARLAGRSEEHVARVVKARTGQNPTDLLNAHRMRHAAHLLAATDRKVLDVALECGCASLGHFYALFGKHHGCSPAAYRRRQPPRPV